MPLLSSRTWRAWTDLQHLLQPLMPACRGLWAVDEAVAPDVQALEACCIVVGARLLAVPKATTLVAGSPGAPANEIQTSVCTALAARGQAKPQQQCIVQRQMPSCVASQVALLGCLVTVKPSQVLTQVDKVQCMASMRLGLAALPPC